MQCENERWPIPFYFRSFKFISHRVEYLNNYKLLIAANFRAVFRYFSVSLTEHIILLYGIKGKNERKFILNNLLWYHSTFLCNMLGYIFG